MCLVGLAQHIVRDSRYRFVNVCTETESVNIKVERKFLATAPEENIKIAMLAAVAVDPKESTRRLSRDSERI